jgi:hypothetical protein
MRHPIKELSAGVYKKKRKREPNLQACNALRTSPDEAATIFAHNAKACFVSREIYDHFCLHITHTSICKSEHA